MSLQPNANLLVSQQSLDGSVKPPSIILVRVLETLVVSCGARLGHPLCRSWLVEGHCLIPKGRIERNVIAATTHKVLPRHYTRWSVRELFPRHSVDEITRCIVFQDAMTEVNASVGGCKAISMERTGQDAPNRAKAPEPAHSRPKPLYRRPSL